MGYRIVYRPVKTLRPQIRNRSRRAALTGIMFMLLLWMVGSFWEEGSNVLCGIFPPTDECANAIKSLIDWCRKLLNNGW